MTDRLLQQGIFDRAGMHALRAKSFDGAGTQGSMHGGHQVQIAPP